MSKFEKTIYGITGVGLGIGAVKGAARLVLNLAKKYPEAAKFIVNVVNEIGNISADKFSNHPNDKLPIEIIKKGKDVFAKIANHELDEHHKRSQKRWY
jgi:hypothetical protein